MAKGGFRGGFGMGGNMGAIMQQAQKMPRDIEVAKAESDALEVDATAGGGVVVPDHRSVRRGSGRCGDAAGSDHRSLQRSIKKARGDLCREDV